MIRSIYFFIILLIPISSYAGYKAQQDITTISSGTTSLDVALPNNVSSMDKAFVILHYFYGHTPGANAQVNQNDGMVSAYLWDNAGTSTLRFQRNSSSVNVAVSWTVIECTDNEFTAYRGSQSWSGTSTAYTPSIGATVNGDNCFAWVNGTTCDQTNTTAVRAAHFTADVSSGSQNSLNLRRYQSSTPSGSLRWIVVEFDPAKIGGFDTGEQTITTEVENSRASWTINGCTKSQSILLGQWRVSGDDGLNAHAIAINMLDNTTGQAYVHDNSNYNRVLRWYCIDFGPSVGNRLEGQIDNSANTTWAIADQALSPTVDPAQALSFVTTTSSGNGTAFPRSMCRHWVSASNTLEIERDYSGQGSWIEWQVLELPVAAATNQPPVVTDIPDQTIGEGSTFTTISLDSYVSDIDNTDAEMVWSYSGNTELTVSIDASRVATITIPDINWNGAETITFRASDPGLLWSEDAATFTVTAVNDDPALTSGVSSVSISPLNRLGNNSTVFTATFTDIDQPAVGSFNVTFKIREPNNTTELILVNNLSHGTGGLTVVDNGGGSFTADYTYDPSVSQALGLYDLFFEVNDGTTSAIDGYTNNSDELEIVQINTPTIIAGATQVSISPVNRYLGNSTVISTDFEDLDQPGVGAFNCTFTVREPDNSTELILVSAQTNGNGGLSIIDNGGGSYTASYAYNPADNQTTGLYDLFFEVADGSGSSIDNFTDNTNELEINEILPPASPVVASGATSTSMSIVNRLGTNSTAVYADFSDQNMPLVSSFSVTFKIREPNDATELILVNSLSHGNGGLTVTDLGNGSYTASYSFDPGDTQTLGFYDLFFEIDDNTGTALATDNYSNNLDELEVIESIENKAPIVQSDATSASPAGIERVGSNLTTISALFTDLDLPGLSAFQVTFKLRLDDLSEIVLANNALSGTGGVTITDLSGGLYEASIGWDPADAQALGFYDLYFQVTDGIDTSTDGFNYNADELQVYDAISNRSPGVFPDTTYAIPASVNRIGSEFTVLKSVFWDADYPGTGSFTVTYKVRSPSSTETTIVNAAKHGEQGLRIVPLGDSLYEATVLWTPSASAAIGLYDLFFEVTDNNGASVIDDYSVNADELTVTSAAPLGDGNLLHRSNNAFGCGGPANACHNIKDHQSQDCRVCHQPHSTTNIYLVRDTIQTPNSGLREVVFRTTGIGDPYNSPDPTPGVWAGAFADDADGVHTGVCEVCHTTVNHHRNDDSHSGQGHNNAQDCTGCHSHTDGFSGGESGGGNGCSCHTEILTAMQDGTASSYHHMILSDNADYNAASKTCLMCHVHHDIFRPDLNPGFGTRASNLRVDLTTPPVQGSAAVLSNSDYSAAGTGGICLSCHTSAQSKSYTQPDGTTQTPVISKTDFDGATSGHNYTIPITFASDGSTFNANCSKCHNDNMAKQYQNSTRTISTHDSETRSMLDSLGIASAANPMEEQFCFRCHSTTSNPNAGSNQDYFGVKGMGTNALNIEAAFGQTYTHPVSSTSGVHSPTEDPATMTRHVECEDCHNPHAAAAGGTGLPNSLKGVSGVDISGNPVASVANSFEICFKCHGDNPGSTQEITRQFNNGRNTRLEFDPASVSYHPVAAVGKNNNSPSLINGWTENSIMTCEDCHAPSVGTVNGPHGSEINKLLKLRYDTGDNLAESSVRYALCYSCHDRNSILGDVAFKEHSLHIEGEKTPCSVCHDAHGSSGQAHLVNFDTSICTSVMGRLEFIDDGQFTGRCYLRCHGKGHSPKNY